VPARRTGQLGRHHRPPAREHWDARWQVGRRGAHLLHRGGGDRSRLVVAEIAGGRGQLGAGPGRDGKQGPDVAGASHLFVARQLVDGSLERNRRLAPAQREGRLELGDGKLVLVVDVFARERRAGSIEVGLRGSTVGQQPGEVVTTRTQQLVDPIRREIMEQRSQRGYDRRKRQAVFAQLGTAADQHARTREAGADQELIEQSRLADSRLAADDDHGRLT
jgi:hypothetical protein